MSLAAHQRIRITGKVREDFYRALANTAKEDLPQFEVLERLRRNFVKTKHPLLPLVTEILGRVRGKKGGSRAELKTVGTELFGIVPEAEALLIQAGEASGQKAEGFLNAADYIVTKRRIQSAIASAMIKPIVYLLAFAGLMLFFSLKLIPQFEKAKPRHLWPESALALGDFADNVMLYIAGGGGLVLMAIVATLYASKRWIGRSRDVADSKIPPFTLIAQIQAANLLSALSGFIGAGIPFADAVAKIRQGASGYTRWQCDRLMSYMRKGKRPEEALALLPMIHADYHWIIDVYGMGTGGPRAYKIIANEMLEKTLGKVTVLFSQVISNICLALLAFGVIWVYSGMMSIADPGSAGM